MPVTIIASDVFPEQGTRGVSITFTDTDGAAVTPNAITWTLTDRPAQFDQAATVINGRENIPVTPAPTVVIVLSGDDLAVLPAESDQKYTARVVTVFFNYDSSDLGSDIDDFIQYVFQIENLYHVS